MPNTLGHLGVQGLITRALIRDADIKWICAGAVLPDLPWILQRLLTPWIAQDRILDARLYFLVQGSLVFCLLLAAGVAGFSRQPSRVFRILGLNVVIHLLLDAAQIRWAEGVYLFAPLSWKMTRFELFWPESIVSIVLTATGLVFVAFAWRSRPGTPLAFSPRSAKTAAFGSLFLVCYFLMPPLFVTSLEQSDDAMFAGLRGDSARAGREVRFDRVRYLDLGESDAVDAFTGERFEVRGLEGAHGAVFSLKGRFLDGQTIQVLQSHEHWPWFRNAASYAGLLIVAAVWLLSRHRGSFA